MAVARSRVCHFETKPEPTLHFVPQKLRKRIFKLGEKRTIFESFYKSAIPASILTRMNQIERIYKKNHGKDSKSFWTGHSNAYAIES